MSRQFTDRTAFDGESLTGTFGVPDGTTALSVKVADGHAELTVAGAENADGSWTATAAASVLAALHGACRWAAYATTADGVEVVANGEIYIRSVVSRYRAVVEAIEEALKNYGSNPNRSITAGEISITYKDYSDLMGILSYWRKRAADDEAGRTASTGGVQLMKVRFG